ncbi:hypothetical protein BDZ45DRAFT_775900 [Acephala macrosclerotiorum]|nr:hypothetical protein BDZ45DRAFT_775900 [Acephala macrosclerotiorum]
MSNSDQCLLNLQLSANTAMDEVIARQRYFGRRWLQRLDPNETRHQFHPRTSDSDWYLKPLVADVRAELMWRGLLQDGDKQELYNRLLADNTLVLSMEGKYDIHKRRLAVMEAEKRRTMADIVPFKGFPAFPPEVLLLIWEFAFRVREDCRSAIAGKDPLPCFTSVSTTTSQTQWDSRCVKNQGMSPSKDIVLVSKHQMFMQI